MTAPPSPYSPIPLQDRPAASLPIADDQFTLEEMIQAAESARLRYRPTPEQLARDEALRRHNRLYVHVPIIIASLVVVGLIVLLLALAFGVGSPAALSFLSAMADLVLILVLIPMIAFSTILPIAYVAWWWNRRQRRKLYPEAGPMAYRSRLQFILWQIESFIEGSHGQLERASTRLTGPLITGNSLFIYAKTFLENLKANFSRS